MAMDMDTQASTATSTRTSMIMATPTGMTTGMVRTDRPKLKVMCMARAATISTDIQHVDPLTATERLTAPSTLLQLMWLASPALPVGSFSYSEGLEAAVEAGVVRTEAQTADWLINQLHIGLGRSDLPVVDRAVAAWRTLDEGAVRSLNAWVLSTRETHEIAQQTMQMGRSMVEWLRNRQPSDERLAMLAALEPAPTWPVAFALAAAQTEASSREILLAFGFGWAEAMVQAALKCVPLGQNAGQRVLALLSEALPDSVESALATQDDEMQCFSPMLAILSARHETQYSRLFRS